MDAGGQHGRDDSFNFFSQHRHDDGGNYFPEHGHDAVGDVFSQHGHDPAGMEFFSQAENSAVGHGAPLRRGYGDIDLNSQAAEFPHMSSYQEFLQGSGSDVAAGQQASVRRRDGKSGRGGVSRRTPSAGDAATNAGAPFRAPQTSTARTRGDEEVPCPPAPRVGVLPPRPTLGLQHLEKMRPMGMRRKKAEMIKLVDGMGDGWAVDSGYLNRPGYLAPYKGTKYHLLEY